MVITVRDLLILVCPDLFKKEVVAVREDFIVQRVRLLQLLVWLAVIVAWMVSVLHQMYVMLVIIVE